MRTQTSNLNFSKGWIVERVIGFQGCLLRLNLSLASSPCRVPLVTFLSRHRLDATRHAVRNKTSCHQTTPYTTTMAPSLEEPQESGTNQLIAPEPEHCPGPESQQAGQGDACQTCPNKEICASAPKGPDLDIPAITERLRDVKHKILVSFTFSPFRGSQS